MVWYSGKSKLFDLKRKQRCGEWEELIISKLGAKQLAVGEGCGWTGGGEWVGVEEFHLSMLSLICLVDIQAETSSRQLNLQFEGKKKVWIGNKKLDIDSVLILKTMRQEKTTKEYGETVSWEYLTIQTLEKRNSKGNLRRM